MLENIGNESISSNVRQVASIFVDESGNKFDRDMFTQSPFFIYAWLLLNKEQESSIKFHVNELLNKEGVPKGSELRAVNMWASARGLKRFNELMKIIHDSGARAYVTFTEKRFEICVLIYETYLDYLDKNITKYDENYEYQKRIFGRKMMNVIYHSVTDEFLQEFRDACVHDDFELIKNIGIRLANILALHPDDEISRTAKLFEEGSKTPFRFGQSYTNSPKNSNLITSHLSLFSITLAYFESELESQGLKAKIIRDQDSVHGDVLNFAYELMVKNMELKSFIGCEEKNSADSIFLQLTDLVAGASERVLRAKRHNKNLKQINRSIWDSLRLSLPLGKWTYQLSSDSCEMSLDSLWDYRTLPQVSSHNVNDSDPLRCNCGEVITSGKIRDYYVHVIKVHPTATVDGFRCKFCKKLIPMWLGACHDVIGHQIEPPFRGDFYGDMQKDYEVLQAVLKSGVHITELR